jgi:dsRNA-specific ribonuclease
MLVQEYAMHFDWFIPELMEELEKRQIIKDLNQAHISALAQNTGSKKGNRVYNDWVRSKQDRLDELEESKLTVFERLRKRKGKGTNTLFDRLKYMKGSK